MDEADYQASSPSPLQFIRHYNSLSSYHFQSTFGTVGISHKPLGLAWTHNYYQGLTVSATEVKLTLSSGQTFLFKPISGAWQADADVDYRLQEILTAGVRTGWKVTTPDDTVETYNAVGDLLSITDRIGTTQTLSYSCKTVGTGCPMVTDVNIAPYAGLLISVTDSYNRRLNFTYNSVGQMATLTDPAGNITRYSYDSSGNLSTVTYPDSTPGDLSNNPKKTYLYGELANTANVSQPHALTGIIDETGTGSIEASKRYATYQYAADGRAVDTQHANGVNKYGLTYNANGSTSVTDPLGTVRTSQFASILGVVKNTGTNQPAGPGVGNTCPAAANAIAYDANGNISRRTDFNGNGTCYAYNARNLETTRVEGLAPGKACPPDLVSYSPAANTVERKITTQWHATWRVPTGFAEPKRLTTLVWGGTNSLCGAAGALCTLTQQATNDANGGQKFSATTTGTARTWNTTYNALGQPRIIDGPRTDVVDKTTYAYYPDTETKVNNRKQLNTITNNIGHVTTYADYDANGRPGTITASNGVISTLLYTPRGQLKTVTTSGRATQLTYYPNGLLNTVTTPTVGVINYGYDDAQRLTSITNAAGEKIAYTLDDLDNPTQDRLLRCQRHRRRHRHQS